MKRKMIPAFATAEGGLFSSVEKADVGDTYQKLSEQGVTMLAWADPFAPDKSMPQHVEEAYVKAVRDVMSPHYTAPVGNLMLKKRIAKRLAEFNGLSVNPERNILITPGSDAGLFYAMLPFIHAGDEVLVPVPSYPNNMLDVRIMGGVVVPVPLSVQNGYQLDLDLMESLVSEKTRMVVLTHPNNPTTTVYNRESLEGLARFVIKHDLILVCDQAFENFTFEHEFISPAALPGMFERTISVFSFSKGMGLSGLRVGYIVCDDVIMDALYANAVAVLGATSTAAQLAVCAALEDTGFMDEFEAAYDRRRQKAFAILNDIEGVHMLLPESGFLAWVDVSHLGDSSDMVAYLIEHANVLVNDGKNYGAGGEGHMRLVLGAYRDDTVIEAALERISATLKRYQKG